MKSISTHRRVYVSTEDWMITYGNKKRWSIDIVSNARNHQWQILAILFSFIISFIYCNFSSSLNVVLSIRCGPYNNHCLKVVTVWFALCNFFVHMVTLWCQSNNACADYCDYSACPSLHVPVELLKALFKDGDITNPKACGCVTGCIFISKSHK